MFAYYLQQETTWKLKMAKKELGNLHVQPPCFILETIMVFSLSWPLTLLPASPKLQELCHLAGVVCMMLFGYESHYPLASVLVLFPKLATISRVNFFWPLKSKQSQRKRNNTHNSAGFKFCGHQTKRQENNQNTYVEDIVDIHMYTHIICEIYMIYTLYLMHTLQIFHTQLHHGITSPSLTLWNLPNLPSNSASTGTLKQFDAQNVKHRLGPLTCRDTFSFCGSI